MYLNTNLRVGICVGGVAISQRQSVAKGIQAAIKAKADTKEIRNNLRSIREIDFNNLGSTLSMASSTSISFSSVISVNNFSLVS